MAAWQSIGSAHEPWPAWVRALSGKSGAYAIRSRGRVLYVGSSRGRLYDTITRHFQQWQRRKKWWKGAYGAGHDPGMTYERGACEVLAVTCARGDELSLEAAWIERYKPRDNLVEHPDGEEAPF